MKYDGKLYGRMGRKHFDIGKTGADWDALEAERDRYREALEQIAGPCSWRELGSDCGTCEQCVANEALKAGKEWA